MSLLESVATRLALGLAPLGALTGILFTTWAGAALAAGPAELVTVATATLAALLVAVAATRITTAPAAGAHPRGPAAPARWRERAHRLLVPRICDPGAPGRRLPRAPSAPLPVA